MAGRRWVRADQAVEDVPTDSPDAAALSAVREPSDTERWKQIETVTGPLYFWSARVDDGMTEFREPMRIRGADGLVEPETLSVTGAFSVAVRGDMVLLKSGEDGGKPVMRLWNARTKKLVASLNDKREASFWPKP
jgi:hypothetical protein